MMTDIPSAAGLSRALSEMAVSVLPDDAGKRMAALVAAKATRPDLDPTDQILLAHYLLTGSGEFPTVEEIHRIEVRNMADELTQAYPYEDGDVLVLGPEVFAREEEGVIHWKGVNFYAIDSPHLDTALRAHEAQEGVPDVIALADSIPPAPTEGPGWKGNAPS